ncbi:TfoX/Sxy family protein [Streptomyces tirandamycinicus]|uniref:TfoX/Sxy family protein n=1 Tax=Streptomyces tirandamycinicus TaxID=2174846 RepID=UPI00037262CD
MAYDEGLAQRIREHLGAPDHITEKRMFGGLSFLCGGNMAVGVIGDELIVRVGPDGAAAALSRPGARVFDFTGRPMHGWVAVAASALAEDAALHGWLDQGHGYALGLPPK